MTDSVWSIDSDYTWIAFGEQDSALSIRCKMTCEPYIPKQLMWFDHFLVLDHKDDSTQRTRHFGCSFNIFMICQQAAHDLRWYTNVYRALRISAGIPKLLCDLILCFCAVHDSPLNVCLYSSLIRQPCASFSDVFRSAHVYLRVPLYICFPPNAFDLLIDGCEWKALAKAPFEIVASQDTTRQDNRLGWKNGDQCITLPTVDVYVKVVFSIGVEHNPFSRVALDVDLTDWPCDMIWFERKDVFQCTIGDLHWYMFEVDMKGQESNQTPRLTFQYDDAAEYAFSDDFYYCVCDYDSLSVNHRCSCCLMAAQTDYE